jgi:hypothetical protein
VAVLAGVSTATVSHVINQTRRTTPETRERVELAIRELRFVPNAAGRALAMRKAGVGPPAFKGGDGGGAKASGDGGAAVKGAEAEAAAPAQTQTATSAVGATRMILRLVLASQPIPRVESSSRTTRPRRRCTRRACACATLRRPRRRTSPW